MDRRAPQLRAPSPVWQVAVALSLWQLVLHAWYGARYSDLALFTAHVAAWLTDVLVLALLAVIAGALGGGRTRVSGIASVAGVTLLAASGALLALAPQLLRAYLQLPANVFSTDGATILVLVTEYIGVSRLWPGAVAVGIAVAASWRPIEPAPGPLARVFVGAVLLVGVIGLPSSPHPVAHSAREVLRDALEPGDRAVPRLRRDPGAPSDTLVADAATLSLDGAWSADHVFLIVLEGVTTAAFEREFLTIPDGFYTAHRGHAAYYPRHLATNLDSYTSLIAMLTGIQVPYRAYADEPLFARVNQAPGLVDAFRKSGAFTAFVSTYAYQPFVPMRPQWDQVLDRTSLPGPGHWISVGSSRMEAATEDRAALSTLLDLAVRHSRAFLVQEMVYGHSTEWQARTGVGQLAYYDRFLRELFDGLRERRLDARSLIVIVSDHGDRAQPAVADNYHVPLLVVGRQVGGGERHSVTSHLDLPTIITAELIGGPAPVSRSGQLVVGSTERWVYGRLDAGGAYVFLDDPRGRVLAARGGIRAEAVYEAFQHLVDAFAARFGPSSPRR